MGLVWLVVAFYLRAIVVIMFNKPPLLLFRVASTEYFYKVLLLLVLLLCTVPFGYTIMEMLPSQTCGPFRFDYDKISSIYIYILLNKITVVNVVMMELILLVII